MELKIKDWFKKNPDRLKFGADFAKDLDRQFRGFLLPGSIIGSVAWLDYAFNTDPKLHPEYPQLFYFRMGLTAIAVVIFFTSFIPAVREKGAFSLKVLISSVVFVVSWFTGRIADDANYVSGLQLVIMIPLVAPISRLLFISMQGISAVLFVAAVLVYRPNLSTASAKYSMNNLLAAYVLAIAFSLFLDRIRFNSFMNMRNIERKNQEIELQIHRINELKTQQDGDYFLTAQLLQPLAMNRTEPSKISIDFLTEQKKKFQFKHWSSEIGGDISSANTIMLRQKNYIAFINGDAMGKSIQGAGGALVLGTVFKSFLHRTQYDDMSQFRFPEQWLRDCYEELHHVLASFDGRMLVSAVIGLIDESSGMLYYVNAEHPWVALLRHGVATFIENELALRKLGMPDSGEHLRIKTFQLLEGDQLFVGSDGRDDIALGRDERGNTQINSDENQFLRVLERAQGDLKDIRAELENMGDITDDLSLVRIHFAGSGKNILARANLTALQKSYAKIDYAEANVLLQNLEAQDSGDPEALCKRALLNARVNNYARAAAWGEEYCNFDPSSLAMIHHTARMLKHCSRGEKSVLKRAADYAERLVLREPTNLAGLVNLADIYRLLDKRDRAQAYLAKARAINTESATVVKLSTLLQDA